MFLGYTDFILKICTVYPISLGRLSPLWPWLCYLKSLTMGIGWELGRKKRGEEKSIAGIIHQAWVPKLALHIREE